MFWVIWEKHFCFCPPRLFGTQEYVSIIKLCHKSLFCFLSNNKKRSRVLKVVLGVFLKFIPEFQAIVFKVVSENVMPLCYLLYHQIVKARVECFIMGWNPFWSCSIYMDLYFQGVNMKSLKLSNRQEIES